jgi:hypothetical protein
MVVLIAYYPEPIRVPSFVNFPFKLTSMKTTKLPSEADSLLQRLEEHLWSTQ